MHSIWTSNKKEDNNYNSADHHRQWYVKKKTTVSNRITSANGKFFSMMELGAREYTCHGLPLQTHSYLLPFYLFFFLKVASTASLSSFFGSYLLSVCVCVRRTRTKERVVVEKKSHRRLVFFLPLSKKSFATSFFSSDPQPKRTVAPPGGVLAKFLLLFFSLRPPIVCTRYFIQLTFDIGRDRPKWSKACF